MDQRGRQSQEGLAVIKPGFTRPKAPEGLSVEEISEWDAIVGRMPADWFTRETHSLLVRFLNHWTTAKNLTERIKKIDECEDINISDYAKLVRLRNVESAQMVNLARAMRLTQHSRLKAESAHVRASKGKEGKPWTEASGTSNG